QGGGIFYGAADLENSHGAMQTTNVNAFLTDYGYTTQFGIKVVAGRTFSPQYPTDHTRAAILNETAVSLLGYTNPTQAVGKRFQQFGTKGYIIGVVRDFHFRSLQEKIKPLIMYLNPANCE